MNLASISEIFDKFENDDFVFKTAISTPHSYRGYYDELAFESDDNVTLREVKESIHKAETESFEGYKGGEYNYDGRTTCHLTYYGGCNEDDDIKFEALVGKMLIEYVMAND
jgi:hypothetical protein